MLFYSNNSLYELPDGFRYAEYHIRNNSRYYELSSIEKTPYLQAVLTHAAQGASLRSLVDLLVAAEEVTEEEARAFITHMWASQLLLGAGALYNRSRSAIRPDRAAGGHGTGRRHYATAESFTGTGTKTLLKGVAYYQRIEQALSELNPHLQIPGSKIQTDLFLHARQSQVNRQLVEAIIGQAEALKALSRRNRNNNLESFKTKFYSRYEEAEIPLAIALDADLGLGYATVQDELSGGGELIDGLAIQGSREQPSFVFDYIQQFVQGKYFAWQAGSSRYRDNGRGAEKLGKQTEDFQFASSMYIMGSLFKENGQLDDRHFSFDLTGYGGPSAANLLGRALMATSGWAILPATSLNRKRRASRCALCRGGAPAPGPHR